MIVHHAKAFVFISLLVVLLVQPCHGIRTRLTWVNGIGYSKEHMEDGKLKIQKLFGGKNVYYCHNPTAMAHEDDLVGYLGDLSQAGSQKLGRITEEVTSLTEHLIDAVKKVGKRGKVIHIAHSQGALVTSLAAKRLSPEQMSRIEVISFGGAAALQRTATTPFSRCVNYYSANDPLLLLVPSAAQALRSGFIADEEFCFLAPREGDPVADHALLGLTYGEALAWEGKRFQRLYQSSLKRFHRSILLYAAILLTGSVDQIKEVVKHLIRSLIVFLYVKFLTIWTFFKCRIVAPTLVFLLVVFDFATASIRGFRREEYVLARSPEKKEGEQLAT